MHKPETLHTIGCSYTSYNWPTWAAYLGLFYDKYYNYGKCGAGNSYIFTTLVNKLTSGQIKKGDTVVVQWSSVIREDRILTNHTGYTTPGCIKNQDLYNQAFVNTYFNPIQKVYELISYITSIKALAKEYKFKLKMLYMITPWFGDFLGEPINFQIGKHFADSEYIKDHKLLDVLQKDYRTSKEYINTSIEETRSTVDSLTGWSNNLQKDYHPLPYEHLHYTLKYILPYLNTPKQINTETLLTEARERSNILADLNNYINKTEDQENSQFDVNEKIYSKLNFKFDIATNTFTEISLKNLI